MKRILALGLITIFALPIMSTAVVMAEDAGTTTTTPGTKPAAVTSTDNAKALQARLELRKAELKIKLSAVEKLNIQTKCKAAQGSVSSVKGRIKGLETSRSEVYTNVITRLTDLSAKLKNKGIDTKAFDAAITALQAKIAGFNTDLAAYKQAVSDLADMDCKTDPDGFKASLQAARTTLDTVNKDGVAVRAFINDTIKPVLKTIRDSLEKNTTGGSQ